MIYSAKPAKINTLLAIMMIIIMVVIFATYGLVDIPLFSDGQYSDQHYYKLSYEGSITTGYFERGYYLLTVLFRKIGFNYQQFKLIMAILSVLLIARSLSGLDINYVLVLVLYFCSAFQTDLEQTRNFFAMSVVIYSLHFLFEDNRHPANSLKYCIGILLAASIHTASLFFLIFLFCRNKDVFKILDWAYVLVLFICTTLKLVPAIRIGIGQIVYMITRSERTIMWFSFNTGLGFFACALLQGLLLAIFWYQMRQLRTVYGVEYEVKTENMVLCMYRGLQLLSFAMPLYLFSTEFLRLLRSLFIVFFVVILVGARQIDQEIKVKDYKYIYSSLLIAFVIVYIIVFRPFDITYLYYSLI